MNRQYEISIPDAAFENLLRLDEPKGLFTRYSWNLNDIPGESDDDINADVLGYIFEKYINQKEFGAYYTRPEITEYLCEKTIYKLILDRTSEPDIEGLPRGRWFESVPELLVRLDRTMARRLIHDVLPDLTILDPAVGSGAFLVAALKTLITVYSAVVGWLKFHDDVWLHEHLQTKMNTDLSRVQYAIKKAIITDNLYGVDLMEEATEIAKLRLFMTLVASARTVDELEPLPNIDFNILAGNSLIGLTRIEEAQFESTQRAKDKTPDLFREAVSYRKVVDDYTREVEIIRHSSEYAEDLSSMRDTTIKKKRFAYGILNQLLEHTFDDLGVKFEQATWDEEKWAEGKPFRRPVTVDDIDNSTDRDLGLKPFHWGFEFDKIINQRGGFDVVIGNPPWQVFQPDEKEFIRDRYDAEVQKNVIRIEDWNDRFRQYLKDPQIRQDWLKFKSSFHFQSAYFKVASEYGAIRTLSKLNLYALFAERCTRLLRSGGIGGIVLPSGIYTDLGLTGLRKMLFEECRVVGLFCFENRQGLFEGVDSRFKFVVLNYQKTGTTESFPAAFMRHDVAELSSFPEVGAVHIPMSLIRKMSPETLAVPEYRNQLEIDLAQKVVELPRLNSDHGGWRLELYGEELNMTRSIDDFVRRETPFPVFEGGMIWHFDHRFGSPRYWIDEPLIRESFQRKRAKRINGFSGPISLLQNDYTTYRIGIRKIASNTNERTLVCTILPRNAFAGNSLSVHFPFRNDCTNPNLLSFSFSEQLMLVGSLNSFVADYLLRSTMTTNVNLFLLYQIRLPRLSRQDPRFASIVRRSARLVCTTDVFADLWNEVDSDIGMEGAINSSNRSKQRWSPSVAAVASHERSQLRSELDALVAHLYGLTEEEFRHVLSTFPLVDPGVRDAALAAYRSVSAGRIQ